MIRSSLLAFALTAFTASSAMAVTVNGVSASKDGRITSVPYGSAHYTPPPSLVPGKNLVFSNVGYKYPNGLYFCCYGNTISGTASLIGSVNWVAMGFTPAADADLKEIDVGVGYVTGTNKVIISLYDDNGGVPGKVIKKWPVTGLGAFGACCQIEVGRARGISLTAGTPYWVAVTTDGADSDTWAAWPFNSTDQINAVPIAVNQGSGWSNAGGEIPAPNFAVIGR
jgi:hypothetical protein